MKDQILSQSPISRDPFQQARNQHDSRNQKSSETILSSSPISSPSPDAVKPAALADFKPMLQKLGIKPDIQMTEMGKIQLVGRLKQKFGEGLSQNKEALEILDLFNQHLSQNVDEAKNMMNRSLSGANRTLAALFGGDSV